MLWSLCLFACVFCNLWYATNGGFHNEVCSYRNTAFIKGNKITLPRIPKLANYPQCVDITKIGKHLSTKIFLDMDLFRSVETVIGDAAGLKNMMNTSKLINLQQMYLSNNKIRRLESHAFIQNTKFKILLLSKNKIRIPRMEPILISDSLDTLDLSNNGFRKIYPRTFEKLPKLRVLYLQGNLLTTIPFDALTNTRHLSFLQLEGNPIRKFDFHMPRNLKWENVIHENLNVYDSLELL